MMMCKRTIAPGGDGLLWVIFAFFLFLTVYVNPFRETATADDWAYARTCWTLMEEGRYEPHAWLAASMPFQAAWGALFCGLLGKSFAALRISTLILALGGALAFRGLAECLGLPRQTRWLLALALLSSPLFVRLGFSFMTNVPFLMTSLTALWLYSRGLRDRSLTVVLLGSIAATAAVLTRQFGVALLIGMAFWWLFDGMQFRKLPIVVAGVFLPACAGIWQVMAGIRSPNWGADYTKLAQTFYAGEHAILIANMLLRPAIILQYLALFCLPFAAWACVDFVRGQGWRGTLLWFFSLGGYMATSMLWQWHLDRSMLMPYLPWNFGFLACQPHWVRMALTLATAMGGIALGRIFCLRWFGPGGWRTLSDGDRLVDLFSVCIIGMHLVFFQLGDEYILTLVPFTLLAVVRRIKDRLAVVYAPFVAAFILVWVASAEWTRSSLAAEEAQWQSAEALVRQGAAVEKVYGPWTWTAYYRFDGYLKDIGSRPRRDLKDFWGRWLPEQLRQARFWVRDSDELPPGEEGWKLIGRRPYRGFGFAKREVFVFERNTHRGGAENAE
jgi:hypothetical protein